MTSPFTEAIAEVDDALAAIASAITDAQRAYVAYRDALMHTQTELARVRRRLREIDADATPVHEVRAPSGVTRAPRSLTPPPRGHAVDPLSARAIVDEVESARRDRRPR